MQKLKLYLVILGLCCGMVPFGLHAQELDATVTINTQQLEGGLRDRFETLRNDLQEFINGQQWTSVQFSQIEKIKCSFALTISEMTDNDHYLASMTVQSRRPVFNSSYNSNLVNLRDESISFEYTEGQTLNYNEFNLDNELVASVAYYIYIILGVDFDSFSMHGGDAYLKTAENIVNQMQTSDNKGWKAFADNKNRHAIITALTDDSMSEYRDLWYTYHRSGLDQMSQSVDKGRASISESCRLLSKVHKTNPQTPLLGLFIDTKIDELANVYSKAPREEKAEIYKLLSEIYPTYKNKLDRIRE